MSRLFGPVATAQGPDGSLRRSEQNSPALQPKNCLSKRETAAAVIRATTAAILRPTGMRRPFGRYLKSQCLGLIELFVL